MPLSGIKVVDLSRYLPGPYTAYLLGDYGADVIRIEQPAEIAKKRKTQRQDQMTEPQLRHIKACEMVARNKKAVMISLRSPEGQEVIRRLVKDADVVISDYRPGVMESMGLGYVDLKAVNPRIIYCAVSACGQTGPYSSLAGHDPIALSIAGVLTRFGDGPDAPNQVGAPVGDITCALHATIGILMALRHRDATGEGQMIDAAMSDTAFAVVTSPIQRMLAGGAEPPRNIVMANNGLWKTKDDRWVATTDMEPAYWARFCEAVGRPDLLPRIHDRPATDADLAEIFRQKTRDEWFEIVRKNDLQGAPVLSLAEALENEHQIARGNVIEVETEDGETITHLGHLIKLSATPGRIRHLARMPGADNAEVLGGLGYSEAEIAALAAV